MSSAPVAVQPNTSILLHERLLRILELTQKLAQPHDLSGMLEQVLEAGLDVLQAESGSLWLYDASNNVINMHLPVLASPISVSFGQGLVGECLATSKVINVPDCYADPRFNSSVDKGTGFKTRSMLSVPLVGADEAQVGVLQLLNKRGGPFDKADERIAVALAAQSAVALQRAQGMDAMLAKERQDEEIALARDVQMSTLPEEMPAVREYDFAAGFVPADFTGGDLYDLVEIDGEVFILVGDATGHGIAPALSATQMQAMFRVAFRLGASLDQAYIHVNNQMVEDLQDNKFLTAFIGFLNHEHHTLRYHSAGQGPLVHYRAAANRCDFHPPTSFPVGVMEIDEVEPPCEILLNQGDIFAVISDGVFEYENAAREQFGEQRLAELIQAFTGDSMDELRQAIFEALAEFAQDADQLDDITIVLIRRVPDPESGQP
jgi:sigma-B regulation protein RsbU (phosphoserine phosphatase)